MSKESTNPIIAANEDDRRQMRREERAFNKRHGNLPNGDYDTNNDRANDTHAWSRPTQGSDGCYGYEGTPSVYSNPERFYDADKVDTTHPLPKIDSKHFPEDAL